ncbi:hypothetical protein BJ165DRAFT_1439685 [Panaeolus papilionaceus]|nr:hypothetical protein BJ165DRAFT_1439685 [Panaeolus papilionaceus]
MTSALPLSALTLRIANREQTIESRKRSFHEWGRGLSLDQYLERDAKTDQHEIAKDGRLLTWVLVRRDSAEDLSFLCACETFKREGAVSRKGEKGIENVVCYGIASVFTPAENRKKGYGAHMMRLLHWMLGPRSSLPHEFPVEWGTSPERNEDLVGDAAFSVLYSDIGPKFYRLSGTSQGKDDGWVVQKSQSTIWKVTQFPEKENQDSTEEPRWTWLDQDSLSGVWDIDTEMMKSELVNYPTPDGSDVACTFFPRGGVADFQILRLQDFWSNLNPLPQYWGLYASSPETPIDLSTFAAWTVEYRPPKINTLLIIRLRASPSTLPAILRQIFRYAKQHSIEQVEIWNLDLRLLSLAESLGAQTFSRDDHLCSLKWYGPYNSNEASRVVWAFNEKFPWC